METYISIIRGINVSGQKKINMNDLKALYAELGFKNIRTYIQSGNVVFESEKTSPDKLLGQIEAKILAKYDFSVPVIIRTAAEMANILKESPFLKEENIETDKLHVTFLATDPEKVNTAKIKELDYGADKFIISAKEVYLYCPGGYGITKLSNNFLENKLKVTATTRNWRTVNELVKIADTRE